METMFDFKPAEVIAPNLGVAIGAEQDSMAAAQKGQNVVSDIQSDIQFSGLQEQQQIERLSDVAKTETAKLRSAEEIADDIRKTQEANQELVDLTDAENDTINLKRQTSGLSAKDKDALYSKHMSTIMSKFKEGKLSSAYVKKMQMELSTMTKDNLSKVQEETNASTIGAASKLGSDLISNPETMKKFQESAMRAGASKDVIDSIPTIASQAALEKGITNFKAGVEAGKYSPEQIEQGLQFFKSKAQEVEDNAIGSYSTKGKSGSGISSDLKSLESDLKGFIKDKAESNIYVAQQGDLFTAYTQTPSDYDFLKKNNGNEIAASKDKEEFLRKQQDYTLGRTVIQNLDDYSPYEKEQLASKNPAFKEAYGQVVSQQIAKAQKVGDYQALNRLVLENPKAVEPITSQIQRIYNVSSDYSEKDPVKLEENRQTFNAIFNDISRMRSAPGGVAAVKNMYPGSSQEMLAIDDIREVITGGDALQAKKLYDQKEKISGEMKDIPSEVKTLLSKGDYDIRNNPDGSKVEYSLKLMHNITPGGLTKEAAQVILDKYNASTFKDEDTGMFLHVDGKPFEKGTEKEVMTEIKKLYPSATSVVVRANGEAIIKGPNGDEWAFNKKTWDEMNKGIQQRVLSTTSAETIYAKETLPGQVKNVTIPLLQAGAEVISATAKQTYKGTIGGVIDKGAEFLDYLSTTDTFKDFKLAANVISAGAKKSTGYIIGDTELMALGELKQAKLMKLPKDSVYPGKDYQNYQADLLEKRAIAKLKALGIIVPKE